MSYLTDDELAAIQHMDRSTPYAIAGVSTGMFSIARYFGGITYNGFEYVYMPTTDECIRMDVIKAVAKLRKKPTGIGGINPAMRDFMKKQSRKP